MGRGGCRGGASTGGGTCPCVCLATGDIVVNGIETTSRWSIVMEAQVFKQANGSILFPAGTYILVYNTGSGIWELDIGHLLTASYLSSVDATSATTMDGTIEMGFDSYGIPYVTVCVVGTVPEEPV